LLAEQHIKHRVTDQGAKLGSSSSARDKIDGNLGNVPPEGDAQDAGYLLQAQELHHVENGAFPNGGYVEVNTHGSPNSSRETRHLSNYIHPASCGPTAQDANRPMIWSEGLRLASPPEPAPAGQSTPGGPPCDHRRGSCGRQESDNSRAPC